MKTFAALLSLIFLLTLTPPAHAQYTHVFGGTSFDTGLGVAADADGNAYYIGEFRGTLDFDPGPGTTSLTSTQTDVYVLSFDDAGDLRFAFQIGNAFGTSESAGGIALDGAANLFVTGSQPFGTIDYDPGPGMTDRTGKLFIASYTSSSALRFAVTPRGTGDFPGAASGKGQDVATDAFGNVYVTGDFDNAIDFNPDGAPSQALISEGSTDAFVASYTNGGTFRFAFRIGGTEADQGFGVAADAAGNVYVTGLFRGTVSFDPDDSDNDSDTEDRTAAGNADLFFASYTSTGDFRFVYTFGGSTSNQDTGYSVDTDAAGNAYLTGVFYGTVDFDPEDTDGNTDTETRTSNANGSMFVASYTSTGVFRFASVPTGSNSLGRRVLTSAAGASYVTGTFGGTTDFDPGPGTAELSAGTGSDVFAARYDAAGAYVEAFGFGGDGLNMGNGIALDGSDNVFLTGEFTGTTDFDPDSGTDERTSAGQNDSFTAKYAASLLPVELTSFSAVADGGAVLVQWTTASETNNAGFALQMRAADAAGGFEALAFIEGGGTTLAPQAYHHRLTLDPGCYLFRLEQRDYDGSTSLSEEVEVEVGLPEAFRLSPVYPNPLRTQGTLTLAVQQAQHVEVALYDVLGRQVALVHEGPLEAGRTYRFGVDGSRLPAGPYLFRITGRTFTATAQMLRVR